MKKIYILLLFCSLGVFAQPGNLCTDPIVISALPYTTTDDTANYADNYDPSTSTPVSCGAGTAGNYYLGGNDVIYSYTAPTTGTVTIQIPSALGWTGLFVFANCADIGTAPYACSCSSASGNRTISNMPVTAGQTYYIVISSWPSPQTVAFTLTIIDTTLGNHELALTQEVILYPNPVKDNLMLDSSLNTVKGTIFTSNGQRIESKSIVNNQINVSNLQAGFYILELVTEGGQTVHKNFVKAAN
jgi:hypothetical protein